MSALSFQDRLAGFRVGSHSRLHDNRHPVKFKCNVPSDTKLLDASLHKRALPLIFIP